MTYAFVAYEELTEGNINRAIFWNHQAAVDFARTENDAVQAGLVQIETVALVDNYGYPCTISDLPIVAPWASGVA